MDRDRRRLLLGGLGMLAFAGRARARRRGGEDAEPVLVLLQLGGGNDGLSTVVPYGDDAYNAARPSLARTRAEILPLDEYRGLHDALAGLHARYQDGGLAIVEGVGYPHPNRSHFRSWEIWHTADERGRGAGDGWVGRLCDAAFGGRTDANRVIHLGSRVPYSLHSTRHPAAAFTSPAGYRWVRHEEELARFAEAGADASGALALVRERMRDARASSAAVRGAVVHYRTPVEYPDGAFGEALRTAAALVDGGIGTRVVSLELGGFDTHADQRTRHDGLMRTLDAGLNAFADDLARSEPGRNALVVVFSEFGRRVAENASRGTDHGTAGPMLVLGERVRGGLHGAHPSLSELDEGDLVHTTDFRSVYASAIEACFDVRAADVLGAEYPHLELVS